MCELLGIGASTPTDVCSSFTGLVQHGGRAGSHKNGQGITFYRGEGCRTSKDPQPSFRSPITELIQDYSIESCSVVAHTRQANRKMVALEGTHPFTRELWGRNQTCVHNRRLKGYKSLKTGNSHPIGETDNEEAFCWLLHRLTEHYPCTPGNMLGVFRYIATLAGELRERGVLNMLLSGGHYVMAFCSTNLHWITRRAPLDAVKLLNQDVEIDLQRETAPSDVAAAIATQLLTANEAWHKIMPGEWALFCLGGRVV